MTDFASPLNSFVPPIQNADLRSNTEVSLLGLLNGVFRIYVRAAQASFALGGVLMLTACSSPLLIPGITKDKINEELGRAAAERKLPHEGIDTALMPPLQIEMPKITADADVRFDLSVVGAPSAQVFMALVSGTRYSMLLPPDLTGTITVNLKDVNLKEALDTIRELYGYEYKIQGTRIFIQPNTLQSRVFQINYIANRRQGSSDLRVSSSSSSGGSSTAATPTASATSAPSATAATSASSSSRSSDTSRISTSSDTDFWNDLSTALTSIVGTTEGRSVIVNKMSGVLVVRGFPADMRNVENYLKATQLVVERQVMLEAKIVEVTLSKSAQSGINWSMFNSINNGRTMLGVLGPNVGLTTNAALKLGSDTSPTLSVTPGKGGSATSASLTSGFIGLALQTANFSALISFLESQGDVAVLSSPRIATLNNQKALLKVGTDDIFVVNVTPGTSGGANTTSTPPTVVLQTYFSGISLDVTPQIDEDGHIILHVHPAISTVTEVEKIIDIGTGSIFKLPLPSSSINETDSIVRVQNGNIVAIGGLMRQSQSQARSQLPGVGDAPIGNLLGQRSGEFKKSEMVVLIKPTIINSDRDWQDDLQGVRDRVQEIGQQKSPQAEK